MPLTSRPHTADNRAMLDTVRPPGREALVELDARSPAERFRAWPVVKRALDVTMALALLLILVPVLVTIAILIRRSSPGPVLFRQERYGRGRRPFTVLKFRTMDDGVSDDLHRRYIATLVISDSGLDGLKKLTGDPRVTRVGAVLRRTSLDELPQLVNVLRGEMSLIGPRPALDYELEFYEPEHFDRFAVRPGLTGLWQVSGRSELGFCEMLDLDARYAQQTGPMLDASILLRTPGAVVRGRSA